MSGVASSHVSSCIRCRDNGDVVITVAHGGGIASHCRIPREDLTATGEALIALARATPRREEIVFVRPPCASATALENDRSLCASATAREMRGLEAVVAAIRERQSAVRIRLEALQLQMLACDKREEADFVARVANEIAQRCDAICEELTEAAQ